MSEANRDNYAISGRVRVDGRGAAGATVTAVILDVDLTSIGIPAALALAARTDATGTFRIRVPGQVLDFIGRIGVDAADVLLHAMTRDGQSGGALIRIAAAAAPGPVPIDIGAQAAAQQPVEVNFAPEVLDVLLGQGGGVAAPRATGTTVYDTRFFEDRLARLVGANIRSADGAALQREIDRVVVAEEIEGETRFVFRGAGRPRPRGVRAAASYASVSRNGGTAKAAASSAAVAPLAGAEGLAGRHGILFRRAAAELESARLALAALQPAEPESSTEFEAVRSLVDEGLVDLVTSFGSEIRPPVARVRASFEELRGPNGIELLADLAGFQRDPLSDEWTADEASLAEEEAFTRFLELDSYVESLEEQWNTLGTGGQTLNVLSTILGRRLGIVADATRELDYALQTSPGDSSERQFAPIDQDGTTLDEYIAWLSDFVDDSQAQVRTGTVAGLEAIARDAGRLERVASDALHPPAGGWGDPPVAVDVITRHPVRRALEELRVNLEAIEAGR